ncbi:MBL fold metallo-hydrolase [Herbiconiux sp.]|uniref:MBL fold metallo-hydrolase n=1 Tax=Herbiconiux sp. TaxID=1871186 RepID=UPI0025BB4471|nr:MBL fold metallo-hydrolase [Herbiconiux sp.]
MSDAFPRTAGPDAATDYSIWSLEFCHADMPHDFFGGSGIFSNAGIIRIPMLYTLVVGGEVGGKQHVALVDCGFRNDYWLNRYDFSNWHDPAAVLGSVGYTPEDVDVILVSHMHFDHMGNFEAFPNAKLFVQLDEFTGWSEAVASTLQQPEAEQSWVFSSFDPTDLARAAQGIVDGRVVFVKGDEELLPGITARLAKDSHTFGSQWFSIETSNGPYVAAGDTVYWYSNVEKMWAPGYGQGNSFTLLEVYRTLQKELKRETSRIIPGHDSQIAERHTSWIAETGNSVSEITLRADDHSRKPHSAPQLFR